MTAPEPMRRDELLELASLDALGMLEADEAAFFSRSFLEAPRVVQDEIRALQAGVAEDQSLLSQEEPPASLRNKVIDAVLCAIDDESHGLAPIATIGALKKARVAANSQSTIQSIEDFSEVEKHLQAERQLIRARSMNRSLMAWRGATVGLAAALLASFLWLSVIANQAMRVTQLAQSTVTQQELIEQLGSSFTQFLSVPCKVRSLAATVGDSNVAAVMYIDSKTSESFLIVLGLQSNKDFTVRLKSSSEMITNLGKINGAGKVAGVKLAAADLTKLRFEDVEVVDESGLVILTTRIKV